MHWRGQYPVQSTSLKGTPDEFETRCNLRVLTTPRLHPVPTPFPKRMMPLDIRRDLMRLSGLLIDAAAHHPRTPSPNKRPVRWSDPTFISTQPAVNPAVEVRKNTRSVRRPRKLFMRLERWSQMLLICPPQTRRPAQKEGICERFRRPNYHPSVRGLVEMDMINIFWQDPSRVCEVRFGFDKASRMVK